METTVIFLQNLAFSQIIYCIITNALKCIIIL